MKRYFLTVPMITVITACTPAEVQIAEEVIHEAVVAEQAIEADLASHQSPESQNGQERAP